MRRLNNRFAARFSKRLVASYVLDWIVIIVITVLGQNANVLPTPTRPFSLSDLSISYPIKRKPTVPIWLAAVVCILIPAAIIAFVSLLFVPMGKGLHGATGSRLWRRRLWEWHAGWLGLGLSMSFSFLITQSIRNLVAKPRPDFLARCRPDLSKIDQYSVSQYASGMPDSWVLVTSEICTSTNEESLEEGFKSFPSGHGSVAFAGLLYLSLWFMSKFSIYIPIIQNRLRPTIDANQGDRGHLILPISGSSRNAEPTDNTSEIGAEPLRNRAAAAPAILVLLPLVPLALAVWIAITRWNDCRHHGIDIIAGCLVGVLTALFGFHWYHPAPGLGAGWAYGPRTKERSFGVPVGKEGFVDIDRSSSLSSREKVGTDIGESGPV